MFAGRSGAHASERCHAGKYGYHQSLARQTPQRIQSNPTPGIQQPELRRERSSNGTNMAVCNCRIGLSRRRSHRDVVHYPGAGLYRETKLVPRKRLHGVTIQAQHQSWHTSFSGTREFLDFHREFLAQSDDFRLYGADAAGPDPDPAVFPVVAVPSSLLEFQHTSVLSNSFNRPALHQIDAPPLAHTDPGGTQRSWPVRPANLQLGNATFCGYTVSQLGTAIDGPYHGNGHMSIAGHDSPPGSGDMANTNTATRDGAFFQWHKHIDDIYSDWAVSKYQLCDKSGVPIFFGVGPAAVGTAGSDVDRPEGFQPLPGE